MSGEVVDREDGLVVVAGSLFPDIVDPEPEAKLTPSQSLRARQDAKIARGVHPISGLRLLGTDGVTCGSCRHRVHRNGGARDWPKCDLVSPTRGQATDCLARFPACTGYESIWEDA